MAFFQSRFQIDREGLKMTVISSGQSRLIISFAFPSPISEILQTFDPSVVERLSDELARLKAHSDHTKALLEILDL